MLMFAHEASHTRAITNNRDREPPSPIVSPVPPPALRITRVRADLIAKGLTPVVILGGDLNSPPFGPVRYLMGELIGPDSDLWSTVETFKW